FFDVFGPRNTVGLCARDGDELVEAGHWRFEAAPEPESPLQEHALGVRDMIQGLANAPLIRSVAMQRLLLRDAFEQRERVAELRFQNGDDRISGDPVDVREVVRRGFARLWTADHW